MLFYAFALPLPELFTILMQFDAFKLHGKKARVKISTLSLRQGSNNSRAEISIRFNM